MKKRKNKLSKKKKIIIFSTVGTFLALIIGAAIYFISALFEPPVELEEGDSKYQTLYKEVATTGTPTDYDVYDDIAMALWKINNCKEYKSKTTGEAVAAGVTQLVLDSKVVKNDTVMLETISSGLVKMAKQRYVSNEQILMRDGSVKDTSASFDDAKAPECVSKEGYMKRYGWWPTQATGYIICPDTMLEAPVLTKNDNGSYNISMNLNPDGDYAPYWYKREIITNSGSKIIPEFHFIRISMNIDDKWTINYMDVEESYTVKTVGILANTTTNCHVEYSYNDVEFDNKAYSYFKKYDYLKPTDDDDSIDNQEDDNLTILVSSLKNPDGSDLVLDTNIAIDDSSLNGLVALNLEDIQNVKVYAKLNDIYVEYSDSIYLSIGGFKIKCNLDEIKNVFAPLLDALAKPDENALDFDASLIMQDFNSGKKTVNGDNIRLDVTLNILDFKLDLVINVKDNYNETYTFVDASLNTIVEGINISLDIKKSNEVLTHPDKNDFQNLGKLDYLVNDLADIINNKKLELNIHGEYKNVLLNAKAVVDFSDKIKASVDLGVSYNEINLDLALAYIDDTIYVSFGNTNIKCSRETLESIINKYVDNSSFDVKSIISLVLSLDFNKVLKELKLEDNKSTVVIGLTEFFDELGDLKLEISKNEGITVDVLLDEIKLNLNIHKTDKDVYKKNAEYVDINVFVPYVNEIVELVKSKNIALDVNLDLNDIKALGTININFVDGVKLEASLNITYKEINVNLDAYLINNVLYASFLNSNVKLDLSKYLNGDINIDELISLISNIDIENLINSLEFNNDTIELKLDLSSLSSVIGDLIDLSNPVLVEIKSLDEILVSFNSIKFGLGISKSDADYLLPEVEYVDLAPILDNITSLVDVITSKTFEISLNGSINLESLIGVKLDVALDGNLYVDYKDSLKLSGKVNVSFENVSITLDIVFVDNNLYIKLNDTIFEIEVDKISDFINEVMDIFNIDSNLDIDYALINSVVNSLMISGNSIKLDLSSLNEKLGIISLTINNNGLEIDADSLSLGAILNKSAEKNVAAFTGSYITLDNIKALLGNIKNLIDVIQAKRIDANINLSYQNLSLVGEVFIDFNDSLKLKGNLAVSYKELEFNLGFTYIENIFYFDLNNSHAYLTLDELISKLDLNNDINLDEILNKLDSLDINTLLKGLTLNDNTLGISLDLNCFDLDLSKLFADNILKITLDFKNDTTICIDDSLKLSLGIKSFDEEIVVSDYSYSSLDDFLKLGLNIYDLIEGGLFTLKISSVIDLKMINETLNTTLTIDGSINVSLADKSFNGTLKLNVLDMALNTSFVLVDNSLYVELGGIKVKLDLANISNMVSDIKDIFNITDEMKLDLGSINSVLNSITFDENEITFDLSSLISLFSEVSIKAFLESNSLSLESSYITLDLEVIKLESYNAEVPTGTFITNDDIIKLCNNVKKIVDVLNRDSYYLDYSFIVDTGSESTIWNINGSLYFKKATETSSFEAEVMLELLEYKDRTTLNAIHKLHLIAVNDMLYITYGNNPDDPSSLVKVYTSVESLKSLIEKALEAIKIIFKSKLEEIDNQDLLNKNNILDMLSNISISDDSITVLLKDTDNNIMSIILNIGVNDSLLGLTVNNLYLSYNSSLDYKKLSLDLSLVDKNVQVIAPNITGYYDISSLEYLVESVINFAEFKSFKISGTVGMTLLGQTIDVPLEVSFAFVDDEPVVMCHIDMAKVPNLNIAGVTISKKQIYYYYSDGYVYCLRKEGANGDGDKFQVKVTLNEFFSNIAYYLLDFGMNLGKTIMDQVYSASTENVKVDAGKCILNYSFDDNSLSYKIGLDINALTGNSSLGNLNVDLKLMSYIKDNKLTYAIKSIDSFTFDLLGGFIKLKTTEAITVNNFKVVDNSLVYESVSVSEAISYVESYKYPLDYVYKNDEYSSKVKHSVTFNYGKGMDKTVFSAPVGSEISYPAIKTKVVDDVTYLFRGWYLDTAYTKPYNETVIGNDSVTLYAKWDEIKPHKLTISLGDEDLVIDSYYGEELDSYFDFDYRVIDGKVLSFGGIFYDIKFTKEFTSNTMLDEDLSLYVKWNTMNINLSVDGTVVNEDIDSSTKLELNSDNIYYIKKNDAYFGYYGKSITAMLLTNYISLDNVSDESIVVNLYTSVPSSYYTVSFDYNYEKFNTNPFVSVSLLKDNMMTKDLLPYATYDNYDINYWYNENGDYHNGNINELTRVNQTLKAYYATYKGLSYGLEEGNNGSYMVVTAFTAEGNTTVILPKYVYFEGEYRILESISEIKDNNEISTCFTGNDLLENIYFNDGFRIIPRNAFKNCTSLKNVYFSSTVEGLRKNDNKADAFYFNDGNKNSSIHFYFVNNTSLYNDVTNWLASKGTFGRYNYYKNNRTEINNKTIMDVVRELFN